MASGNGNSLSLATKIRYQRFIVARKQRSGAIRIVESDSSSDRYGIFPSASATWHQSSIQTEECRGGRLGLKKTKHRSEKRKIMTTTSPRDLLLAQQNWRYATKQFDPQRKIGTEDWAALEESLRLTPSSFGLQAFRIVNVADPALREKLVPVSWGQRQVAEASHFIVFAIQNNLGEADIAEYLHQIAAIRGIPVESLAMLRDMMLGSIIKGMDAAQRRVWQARQTYIALGNLMTSAALLQIDACPMEGFTPAQYDSILGLDKLNLSAVVACALGYRAATDKYAGYKKVRLPKEDLFLKL
jgi:nitroreductase